MTHHASGDLRSYFMSNTNGNTSTQQLPCKRKRTNNGGSSFYPCPMCFVHFPLHTITTHAASCQGRSSKARIEEKLKTETTTNKSANGHNVFGDNHSPTEGPATAANKDKFPSQSNAKQQRSTLVIPSSKKKEEICHDSNSNKPNKKDMKNAFINGTIMDGKSIQPDSMPLPGLYLFENFIDEEEEAQILATMDNNTSQQEPFLPWEPSTFNGCHFGKRWGVHCNLRTRKVTPPEHPLPSFIKEILMPKLERLQIPEMVRVSWTPNEANAIDYRRKLEHELQNHVDNRQMSKEPIANLSLAGDCYMTFRNENMSTSSSCLITATTSHKTSASNAKSRGMALPTETRVLLKRRCIQVLTGKARYDYSHGIRNSDLLCDRRVSLTMRESPLIVSRSNSIGPTFTINNQKNDRSVTEINQATLQRSFLKKRK